MPAFDMQMHGQASILCPCTWLEVSSCMDFAIIAFAVRKTYSFGLKDLSSCRLLMPDWMPCKLISISVEQMTLSKVSMFLCIFGFVMFWGAINCACCFWSDSISWNVTCWTKYDSSFLPCLLPYKSVKWDSNTEIYRNETQKRRPHSYKTEVSL